MSVGVAHKDSWFGWFKGVCVCRFLLSFSFARVTGFVGQGLWVEGFQAVGFGQGRSKGAGAECIWPASVAHVPRSHSRGLRNLIVNTVRPLRFGA